MPAPLTTATKSGALLPRNSENKKRKIVCFSGSPSHISTRTYGDWPGSSVLTHHLHRFVDFDGTIFMQDSGHILFDNHGCGATKREILDGQIKSGERSFRDVSEEMWGSLNVPFDDGFEVMKQNLELDQGFKDFHQYCVKNDIPFNVISAGLKPVLRKVLDTFLGEEEVCQTSPHRPCYPFINLLHPGANISLTTVLSYRHRCQRGRHHRRWLPVEAALAPRLRTRTRQSQVRSRSPQGGRTPLREWYHPAYRFHWGRRLGPACCP